MVCFYESLANLWESCLFANVNSNFIFLFLYYSSRKNILMGEKTNKYFKIYIYLFQIFYKHKYTLNIYLKTVMKTRWRTYKRKRCPFPNNVILSSSNNEFDGSSNEKSNINFSMNNSIYCHPGTAYIYVYVPASTVCLTRSGDGYWKTRPCVRMNITHKLYPFFLLHDMIITMSNTKLKHGQKRHMNSLRNIMLTVHSESLEKTKKHIR